MNGSLGSGFLTTIMRFVTNVDNWIPVMAPVLAAMLLWRRPPAALLPFRGRLARALRTRSAAVVLVLALATGTTDLAANHLKDLVDRKRPCKDPRVAHLVETRWTVHGTRSFPSSHAANSAALATVTALFYPALAWPAAAFAFLVGFSRIYLGVHYPLDVAAGWLMGILSGGLWFMALRGLAQTKDSWAYTRRFRRPSASGSIPSPPADEGRVPWKKIKTRSLDGLPADAWMYQGGERLAVVVHGLGGGLASAAVPGSELVARGYSVLLCPLRGHDGSGDRPTSGGPEEAYDLLGVLRLARESGFQPGQTLLYGSSMGAGVCLKAAALTGQTYLGAVLHAVVPDFAAAARNKLGKLQSRVLLRMIPADRRRGLAAWKPVVYSSLMAPETPVAALCGSRDSISSPQDAERTVASASRSMVAVLGGAHHPSWLSDRTDMYQYRAALDEILQFINSDIGVMRIYIDENGEVRNLPSSHRKMGAQQ